MCDAPAPSCVTTCMTCGSWKAPSSTRSTARMQDSGMDEWTCGWPGTAAHWLWHPVESSRPCVQLPIALLCPPHSPAVLPAERLGFSRSDFAFINIANTIITRPTIPQSSSLPSSSSPSPSPAPPSFLPQQLLAYVALGSGFQNHTSISSLNHPTTF